MSQGLTVSAAINGQRVWSRAPGLRPFYFMLYWRRSKRTLSARTRWLMSRFHGPMMALGQVLDTTIRHVGNLVSHATFIARPDGRVRSFEEQFRGDLSAGWCARYADVDDGTPTIFGVQRMYFRKAQEIVAGELFHGDSVSISFLEADDANSEPYRFAEPSNAPEMETATEARFQLQVGLVDQEDFSVSGRFGSYSLLFVADPKRRRVNLSCMAYLDGSSQQRQWTSDTGTMRAKLVFAGFDSTMPNDG